jgi:hypothetical protein
MKAACALLSALLALAAVHGAQARVFAGVAWGGSGQADDPRRLDVHAPATPGPHPLVVVAGFDAGERLARGLAAHDHVVALLAGGRGETREEMAQALAFLFWRGPGYGADSTRLNVVASGAAADALLALARDPAPLVGAGVPEGALQAAVLVDWREAPGSGAPPSAQALPALLLVHGAVDASARHGAASWAERWRAFGAAAEAVALAPDPAGGEALADTVRRWLPVAAMPRVPRFETLRFATGTEPLPDGAPARALAAHRGAIYIATESDRLLLWRRAGRAAGWQRELDAGAARALFLGEVAGTASADLALVVARESGWSVRLRAAHGGWGSERQLGGVGGSATAAWVAALPGVGDGEGELLVAIDAGVDSRLFRLRADGSPGIEMLPAGERITGLLVHAGTPLLAVHGVGGGRLLRRVGGAVGAWVTAAAWPAARGALGALASLAPEADAVAGLLAEGTAVRIEPSRGVLMDEADLRGALAAAWGGGGPGAAWSAPMATLYQPHAGDRVHLAGIAARDPRGGPRQGWYVVRQAGGHYAYGRAGDPAADGADGGPLVALVPSPFDGDAGATFLALSGGRSPVLRAARLPEPRVPAGAWIERGSDGDGVVIERTRAGWVALLLRTESDGARRWYSASGRVRGDAFEDATGLVRYRRDGAARLQAEAVGRLSIRFGAEGTDPACAGRPRGGAWALAVLEASFGESRWQACIEPAAPRDRQRPAVDGSGVWMAPDGTWGLAVQSDGHGDDGAERALLFHFDADGLPTWRLGLGERRAGQAVVGLPGATGEARVAYAFRGACGAVEGSARVDWPAGAERPSGGEVALLRTAGGACY